MERRWVSHDLRRLAFVHGFGAAGDALFTVSLAGSLFFSVSVDAARPRILIYLLTTLAPFVLIAPFIGPFVTRVRGGQRTVLVATNLGRSALALALVTDLRTALLFPEALGVLVLGKAYSIGRSATVPRLVDDDDQLVAANAVLARVAIAGGSVGGLAAAGLLQVSGASAVLYTASSLFLAAAVAAVSVRAPLRSAERSNRLGYIELHAARLGAALRSMAVLRGASGALTFLLAFAFKRSGAPLWHFGLVFACSGAGAFSATLVTARLRQRMSEERILTAMLAAPAVAALLGGLQFTLVTAAVVSATLGFGAAGAKHAFDAFAQRTAPDADLAGAFAGFETRFQLSWIVGAVAVILIQVNPRFGLLAIAVLLGGGAAIGHVLIHAAMRHETTPHLAAAVLQLVVEDAQAHDGPQAVLDAAEALLTGGSPQAAVIATSAALDAHLENCRRGPDQGRLTFVRELRNAAVSGSQVRPGDAERAIAIVRDLVADTTLDSG